MIPVSFTLASAHPAPDAEARIVIQTPRSELASMAAPEVTRLQPAALEIADQATAAAPTPTPSPTPSLAPLEPRKPGVAVVVVGPGPRGGGGHFPWGYCTWYVSTRRDIPWSGDAGEWYANAKAMGFSVGSTPRPGAIMVSRESWVGHVAFVEAVDATGGGFTISEMNYRGFGIINQRHVAAGEVPLIGFIY